MKNVIEILEERGFIEAKTHENIASLLSKPTKVYCGFDPTAESLHLGNMVALMGLAWFQRCGHTPIAIAGGATGMVGDPSGKSQERSLLDSETLNKNLKGIRKNLECFLDFECEGEKPQILNNLDWFQTFSFIDFLRDVGKCFRVGPMLAKESVKARLNSEEGMSFTEFSYQLLQAYDFLYLYQNHGVTVQLGGSDQWGNITAGTELIRKVAGGSASGLTFPLLTTSEGKKFGKSEEGAIWLSPEMLSPYQFYQYLIRIADADVINLLRMLTFLPMGDIKDIEAQMASPDYRPNEAQKVLAKEVTRIVHGDEGVEIALKVTESAAPGKDTELNLETLEAISADMPNAECTREMLVNQKLIDVMVHVGAVKSKGEARRLVKNGGVYVNNARIQDGEFTVQEKDLIGDQVLLLAVGKKNKLLVRCS